MFARRLVSPHQAQLLEDRARTMRFSPTRSEEALWRSLAGSKTGFPFRRQLVIANFIVDFASTKVRIVVEIDGASRIGRNRHDASRHAALQALGWHVLRFQEHLIFEDLDAVVQRIGRACSSPASS